VRIEFSCSREAAVVLLDALNKTRIAVTKEAKKRPNCQGLQRKVHTLGALACVIQEELK